MLTPKKVRDIYRRSWAGESGRALAAEFGVSPSFVSQIRNGRRFASLTGHDPAAAPQYPLTANTAEVIRLYREGWTVNALAAEFDVAQETVRQHLLRNGVRLRPAGAAKGSVYRKRR